ncbi:MAG: oligosaccharide flippase family protein [Elusimicrobia bacterium]|nr:oligosaccharide flippase family protein [Elusimicrobiota bacterium]
METSNTHSLKKRYFYKLVSNIFGLGINIVTAGITPRGLGPKNYGDFNFLSSVFLQIKGFLDMGVSVGFYNKISQRQNEQGLIAFYFHFLTIASCLIFLFIMVLHGTGLYTLVFPDQKLIFIYMSAILIILTWFGQGFDQMTDAFGLTIYSERARMLQKALGAGLLIVLFLYQILTLRNYFYYQYFNQIVLTGMFIWVINTNKGLIKKQWKLTLSQIKTYFFEFYHYSFPIFVEASIGTVAVFFDRWLLQIFGGSIQQGFYSFSYNIGALCFLFTGAMTPLLSREYAIAHANNDIKKMALLFRRFVPVFYSLAAFFSCFVIIQSEKIVYILGGNAYKTANLAVKIMAIYPIFQVYGQLSTSVLLAAGKTKLYRNIGIFSSIAGLLLTFFFLAPTKYFGLNAGANGLAVKMVLIVFVVVNVFLFYISKFLGISFWKYLAHQAVSFGSLLVASFSVSILVDSILKLNGNVIVNFIISGSIYTSIVLLIAYKYPVLFGLKNEDINYAVNFIRKKVSELKPHE